MNSSIINSHLDSIQLALERLDYSVSKESLGEAGLIQYLELPLHEDESGSVSIMEIIQVNDFARFAEEKLEDDRVVLMQFQMTTHLKALPATRDLLLRVLNLINQSLPIGSYGFSEHDVALAFRFILPCLVGTEISDEVISEIIGIAELSIAGIHPLCSEVIRGRLTFEKAVEWITSRGIFGI